MALPMSPLHGAGYLITHPSLLALGLCPLLLSFLWALASFIFMLAAALVPQAYFLINLGVWPWLSWLLAVLLVLLEASLLSVIGATVAFDWVAEKVFLVVLHDELPEQLRATALSENPNIIKFCSGWTMLRLAVLIVSLPLNFVPVAGTVVYFMINGTLYAWKLHQPYFELIGAESVGEQWKIVRAQCRDYLTFGCMAMVLNLIPVISPFFILSNAAAAAMWAASEMAGPSASGERLPPGKVLELIPVGVGAAAAMLTPQGASSS